MTIREIVARAIWQDLWAKGLIDMELPPKHFLIPASVTADAAITAFLVAAAEQGWHMRPDEATEEMAVAGCRHENMGDMAGRYGAMLAASPEFEWDK